LNVADYGSYVGQFKPNIDGVYAGSPVEPLALPGTYKEYGLAKPVFGNPTLVDEGILKNMGDEALGVYSASWYTVDRDTPTTSASSSRSSASTR